MGRGKDSPLESGNGQAREGGFSSQVQGTTGFSSLALPLGCNEGPQVCIDVLLFPEPTPNFTNLFTHAPSLPVYQPKPFLTSHPESQGFGDVVLPAMGTGTGGPRARKVI